MATQSKINESKSYFDIFRFVIKKSHTTRREIESELNFAWGTVSSRVCALIDDGYVEEQTISESKGLGRKTSIIRPSKKIVSIGIDFSAIGITSTITSINGDTLKFFMYPFNVKNSDDIIKTIINLIQESLDYIKQDYKVFSIGISLQGGVEDDIGVFKNFYFIKGFTPIPLKKIIEDKFKIKTFIFNDCYALINDYHRRFSKNLKDRVLIVRIADGIGFGFSNTNIDKDIDFYKNDFGHMIVNEDGNKCICGKKGCLETYSSIRGMVERAGLNNTNRDLLFKNKDQYIDIFKDGGRYLALGIINVIAGFDVQDIVITGSIENLPSIFFESMQEYYDKHIGYIEPKIKIKIIPNISPSYGAALLSAERNANYGK